MAVAPPLPLKGQGPVPTEHEFQLWKKRISDPASFPTPSLLAGRMHHLVTHDNGHPLPTMQRELDHTSPHLAAVSSETRRPAGAGQPKGRRGGGAVINWGQISSYKTGGGLAAAFHRAY